MLVTHKNIHMSTTAATTVPTWSNERGVEYSTMYVNRRVYNMYVKRCVLGLPTTNPTATALDSVVVGPSLIQSRYKALKQSKLRNKSFLDLQQIHSKMIEIYIYLRFQQPIFQAIYIQV
jgi:hypothetical protein